MMSRHRSHFIGNGEVLLVFMGDTRFDDEIIRGPIFEDEIVSKALDFYAVDEAVSFERFDRERRTSEDVTEDVALAYIDDADARGVDVDEDTAPAFVRNSEAFEVRERMPAVPCRDPYSEHRTYHTIGGSVVG